MDAKEVAVSERENQAGDAELGTCHICARTFATQEGLSQHLMDDHEDEETLGDPSVET